MSGCRVLGFFVLIIDGFVIMEFLIVVECIDIFDDYYEILIFDVNELLILYGWFVWSILCKR